MGDRPPTSSAPRPPTSAGGARAGTGAAGTRPKTAGRNTDRPASSRQFPLPQRPPSRLGPPPPPSTMATRPASTVFEPPHSTATDSFAIRPPSHSQTRSSLASAIGRRTSVGSRQGPVAGARIPSRGPPSSAIASGRISTGAARVVGAVGGQIAFAPGTGHHRPVTQQGVSAIRTHSRMGSTAGNRQIADKTYFVGFLNGQLKSLQTEIDSLTNELELTEKGRRNLLLYEQRAEEQANELKQLQTELSKLNLIIDRQNINSDLRDLEFELLESEKVNEGEAAAVDALFAERREKEEMARHLEEKIRETRERNAQKINNIDPALKSIIEDLTIRDENLRIEMDEKQRELDSLNRSKEELDMALANSPLKQQAMVLEEQVRELENKKSALLKELNSEGSPEQQRQTLIERIQKDNEEISHMQIQIQEANERIAQAQEEIREFTNEFEIVASDRSERYRDLRYRNAHYNTFFDTFDDAKAQIEVRIAELSALIVQHLRLISANCERDELNTISAAATGDGALDESIFSLRSANSMTPADLQDLHVRLQEEMISLERTETRLANEFEAMRRKQKEIDEAQTSLEDVDKLHEEGDAKRKESEEKIRQMKEQKAQFDVEIESLDAKVTTVEQTLSRLNADNPRNQEIYAKLRELKSRVDLAEAERKSLQEKLEAQIAKNNFESAKSEALKLRAQYNALITDQARHAR